MMSNKKKRCLDNKHDLCFHSKLLSGLVFNTLTNKVCTLIFTFQTSINERSLPNGSWTLLPSYRITKTAKVPSKFFCLHDYVKWHNRTWNSLEGLPSKYYLGRILLNNSVWMRTGASNMVTKLANDLTALYILLSFNMFLCPISWWICCDRLHR